MKRLLLLLRLAALSGAALAASGPAFASGDWEYVFYYSDDTYTDIVGREFFPCTGPSHLTWGVRSDYPRVESQGECP